MSSSYTLKVGGMTCGGCAASVHRVLSGVTGVTAVTVSLDNALAQVTCGATPADPASLVRAVEGAGFQVGSVSAA